MTFAIIAFCFVADFPLLQELNLYFKVSKATARNIIEELFLIFINGSVYNEVANIFSGLLHKEPSFRLGCRRVSKPEEGAEEIRGHPFFNTPDANTGREAVPWKKMEAGKVSFCVRFSMRFEIFGVFLE